MIFSNQCIPKYSNKLKEYGCIVNEYLDEKICQKNISKPTSCKYFIIAFSTQFCKVNRCVSVIQLLFDFIGILCYRKDCGT